MSARNGKCTFADNIVEPCGLLSRAAEEGNPRGKQKGVFEWALFKLDFSAAEIDMDKPSTVRYGVKSGEFVQKGLIFNYCPFCGEKIDGQTENTDATD